MKKILLSLCIASSLFSQTIDINDKWQLLGAKEDINIANFSSECLDYVWKYDNNHPTTKWQVHIAKDNTYDLSNIGTISSIYKGEGFWIKGSCDDSIDTNSINTNYTEFSTEMLAGKTFYYVSENDNYPSLFAGLKLTYTENNFSINNIYDYEFDNFDYSINNGNLKYNNEDDNVNFEFELTKSTEDYIESKVFKYDNINSNLLSTKTSRFYLNETKAVAYQESLEKYSEDFFASSETFNKPTVIEHVDFEDSVIGRLNFDNYNIEGNQYAKVSNGIELTAIPVSGTKSSMKASLIKRPFYYNGIATVVTTSGLDSQGVVKIQFNAYNDGTEDIQPAVQILQNKISYYLWKSKSELVLKSETILDEMDFSNKEAKIATWVKDSKVHFYAQVDGIVGYKTFDITGYENNALEESHWANMKVEVKDGGDTNTATFNKIYTLR